MQVYPRNGQSQWKPVIRRNSLGYFTAVVTSGTFSSGRWNFQTVDGITREGHKFKGWIGARGNNSGATSRAPLPQVPELAAKFSNKFASVTGRRTGDVVATTKSSSSSFSSSFWQRRSADGRLYFLATTSAKHCHRPYVNFKQQVQFPFNFPCTQPSPGSRRHSNRSPWHSTSRFAITLL